MCGIVAACTHRDVVPILLAGLHALEYRGYDSAGIAVLDQGRLTRLRSVGKVAGLDTLCQASTLFVRPRPCAGVPALPTPVGPPTAFSTKPTPTPTSRATPSRWSTTGSSRTHAKLRAELQAAGYVFTSETDTEVVAHLVHKLVADGKGLQEAVSEAVHRLRDAYAITVIHVDAPGHVVGARRGSPLCVEVGIGEYFLGSDVQALIQVTNRIVYLDDGDIVEITPDTLTILDAAGQGVTRRVRESDMSLDAVERGDFRHYMLKEIFEQPTAVANTLEGRSPTGTPYPISSASTRTSCCSRYAMSTSLPAAPASTPAWWRVTGWKTSQGFPARSNMIPNVHLSGAATASMDATAG